MQNTTTGTNNTAIGYAAGITDTTGSYNIIIGNSSLANNNNDCIIIGNGALATGNNQFVVGSISNPVGTLVVESTTPDVSWLVNINGGNYKIPLQFVP